MYRPPLSHMCQPIFRGKKELMRRAWSESYCISACLANDNTVSHFMVLALHFLTRCLAQVDVKEESFFLLRQQVAEVTNLCKRLCEDISMGCFVKMFRSCPRHMRRCFARRVLRVAFFAPVRAQNCKSMLCISSSCLPQALSCLVRDHVASCV